MLGSMADTGQGMQQDLLALEQRWGLALQSAGFGVWDLDVQAHRVRYSPQWKAMLGYGSSDEADSTSVWRERVHPQDLQAMLQALSSHLHGHRPAYEMEFRLRAADGSWRWVLSRGRVVERDAQGLALRAVGTLTDLSARREAEQLRAERDRALAASQAKSEFLSRMSHELRTPLNAVLGFAQLLSQRLGQATVQEQQRHIAQIEQSGWHLLRLIDQLLALSEAGSDQLDQQLQALQPPGSMAGAAQHPPPG
jgi:PAS domain S-box-containing protein